MKIKIIAFLALVAVNVNMSAQFTDLSLSDDDDNEISTKTKRGWNSVWLQANPGSLHVLGISRDLMGFSAGYSKAFNFTPSSPLFLEIGAGFQYSSYSYNDKDDYYGDEKTDFNMTSLKIPIRLLFKSKIPDSQVQFAFFLGLMNRFNFDARETTTDNKGRKEKLNLLDLGVYKRFQTGWEIGVQVHLYKFMLGISYGNDITAIEKVPETKIRTISATMGLCF